MLSIIPSYKSLTNARIYILVLIFILCPLLYGQSPQKITWDNGSTRAEGSVNAQGVRIGEWSFYYKNGVKEAVGSYSGKKTDRNYEPFRRSKNTALDDQISKHGREGLWHFYYDNKEPLCNINYLNGCPVGKAVRYHRTGVKAEETNFKNCEPYAPRVLWDQKGVKYFESKVESENKTADYEYYNNGKTKAITPFVDGEQYGIVKRYYENGQREEEAMMKDHKVHGHYRSWFSNGKKYREFFSISNIMSGEFREWNENGVLIKEIIEDKDLQTIVVRTFWENGQLKMKGTSKTPPSHSIYHWSQSQHGSWTYWDKNGNVQKTENYQNGKLISIDMP